MSFYNVLKEWKSFDFNSYFERVSEEDIIRSINKNTLDSYDLLNIISPKAEEFLEKMAIKVRDNTLKYTGRTILLYTPMYISNYCVNKCAYCGYNVENKIKRRKLNMKEIEEEGQAIRNEGFRELLLLTGESEYHTPVSYIKEGVKRLNSIFPSISIEVYPMKEEGYKELIDEGVNGLTIYQETYDEEVYDKVHLEGPKKDFKFRLDAPERGAKAGMRNIGMGALLGLSEFRKDVFFTALHGKYLLEKYPYLELSFGPPRIRPCVGGFNDIKEITDSNLVQSMLVYKLFYPQGGLNITTRESNELRKFLIPLGVTKMSAGVKTEVGGRTLKEKGQGQFSINDESSTKEVKNLIKECGYQPIFKDWIRI